MAKRGLTIESIDRLDAYDVAALLDILPDPDPVLRTQGQDIRIYRNVYADAHVFSCALSRRSGVLSQEWELRGDDVDERVKEFVTEEIGRLVDRGNIISQILEAPLYGYTIGEVIWAVRNGLYVPDRVLFKPQEWFRFTPEGEPRFMSTKSAEGVPLTDRYKFLVVQHYPTYRNPYGERVLSRCFWPLTFKKGGLKFWAIFCEKYGIPFLVGKYGAGADQKDIERLGAALEEMVQDAVACIPENSNIEFLKAENKTGSQDIFSGLITTCNAEISKAILGQTLSTEVGDTGSYAAARAHLDVRGDIVDSDKKLVRGAMDQLIAWMVELNFGPDVPAPTFTFFEEEETKAEWAERDKSLYEQGVRLSKEYYARTYNIPEEDLEIAEDVPEPEEEEPEATPKEEPGEEPEEKEEKEPEEKEAKASDVGEYETFRKSSMARRRTGEEMVQLLKMTDGGAPDFFREAAGQVRQVTDALEAAKSFKAAKKNLYQLSAKYESESLRRLLFCSALLGMSQVAAEAASFDEDLTAPLPFREAMDHFAGKVSLVPEEFYALDEQARQKAFTVSNLMDEMLIGDISDELVKAVGKGVSYDDWVHGVGEMMVRKGYAPEGALTPWRMELVYRNAAQSSYAYGRYEQMKTVADKRPYWMYCAVLDSRTRPSHAAMDGRVYKADDPIWDEWYPPNGHACRCSVTSFTQEEVKDEGLDVRLTRPSVGGKVVTPDEGWSHSPVKWWNEREMEARIAKVRQRYRGPEEVSIDLAKIKSSGSAMRRNIDANPKMVETRELFRERDRLAREANAKTKALREYNSRVGTLGPEVTTDEINETLQRLYREAKETYAQLDEISEKVGNSLAAVVRVELETVRPTGARGVSFAKGSSREMRAHVDSAAKNYPAKWVELSNDMGEIKVKKVKRGYYCHKDQVLAVSGSGDAARSTALHELGHRMERVVPGLREAEAKFYASRTEGEPLRWLGDFYPGCGYSKREVARKDDFTDAYMGKDYGGNAYELFSMGVEGTFFGKYRLWQDDPEYVDFILGVLATL